MNLLLRPVRSSVGSKYVMAVTGLALLAFVIYHLLHFTFGLTDPEHFKRNTALYTPQPVDPGVHPEYDVGNCSIPLAILLGFRPS